MFCFLCLFQGENKYTFVEECKKPNAVTILLKGPNKYTLVQLKDAVRDGLRAINNAINDKAIIPGAGAFEITASRALSKYKEEVKGKLRLGVQAFSDALLVIPKALAVNSGFDAQETIVKLLEETAALGEPVGFDINSGEALKPSDAGIYDNYIVKKQIINSCTVIASNLLLVDEIMRAGLSSLKG